MCFPPLMSNPCKILSLSAALVCFGATLPAQAQQAPPVITRPIGVWWGSYRNNEDLTNVSAWSFVQQNMDGYLLHGAYWNYSNNTIGSPSPALIGPALAAILRTNNKPVMLEHLLAGDYPDVNGNFGQDFAGTTNDPAGFTSGIGNLRRLTNYGFNVTHVSTDYIMSAWTRSMRFHPDWTSQEFFTAISGNWQSYGGALFNTNNGSSDRNTYGWFRQWVERLAAAFPALRISTVNSPVYFSWDDNGDVLRELGDSINSYSAWLKLEKRGTNLTALVSADGGGWKTLAATNLGLGAGTVGGFFVASLGSRLAEGRFDNVQTLPFFEQDIGSPGSSGAVVIGATNLTLTGTGDEYLHGGGTTPSSDSHYYAYTERSGDETWTVRLDSLAGSNTNRTNAAGEKPTAGLTVRESTAANARQISLHCTLAKTLEFTMRSANAGNLTNVVTALANAGAPRWLRITRSSGTNFAAAHSGDGLNWTNVGSAVLGGAPSKLLIGLVADSQVRYETNTAVFSQCSFIANFAPSFSGVTLGSAGAATSSFSGGVVTNTAAGVGAAGTSDNLRFHSASWTNDGTLSARMLYFADDLSPGTSLATNAQMGLMFRTDSNAVSPNFSVFFTPGQGIIASARGASNAVATNLAANGAGQTSIQTWDGSYRPLFRYFTGNDFISSLHESFTNASYTNNFSGFTTDSPYRGYQIWGGSESATEAIRHRRKIRAYEQWLQDRGREHHFIANSIPTGFDTSTQSGKDGWDARYKQDSMRSIQLHQLEGGRPDKVIFESWYDGPFRMVPESTNGSFANLVRDGIYFLKGMPDPQRLDLLVRAPGTTNWSGLGLRQTDPSGSQVVSASSSSTGEPVVLTVRLTNSAGVPALPVLHAFETGAASGWVTSYTLSSGSVTGSVTTAIQSAAGQMVTDEPLFGGGELIEPGKTADLEVRVTPTAAIAKKKILLRAFWNPQDPSLAPHDAVSLEIAPPPELIQNGSFENGTTGWTANGGAISVVSTNAFDGTNAIKSTRSQPYQGPAQDILGRLIVGQTYRLGARARVDSNANIKATIAYSGTNTNTVFTGITTLSNAGTNWQSLQGYFKYAEPNGAATSLKLYFETTGSPTNTGPLYIDAVSLVLVGPEWKTATPGSHNWGSSFNWQSGNTPSSSSVNQMSFLPGVTLSNGTVTAQQNLAAPFVMNSLLLSGNSPAAGTAIVQITGGALQFAENDGVAPSLELAASNNVSYLISTPAQLSADATVAGDGAGMFELAGSVSGAGALVKTGESVFRLSASNSFSGSVTLAGGTLEVSNACSLGTGAFSYSGGILRSVNISNPVITNPVFLLANPRMEGAFTLSSPLQFVADRIFDIAAGGNVTLSGSVSDDIASRKFIKSGSGTLVLANSNSFRGYLTISNGVLRASDANALPGTNGIDIQGGTNIASLDLAGGMSVAKPVQIVMHTQTNVPFGQLRNVAGTNILGGVLKLNGGGSRWDVHSLAGMVVFEGAVTNLNTGTDTWRTLHLSGPGSGMFNGPIHDGGASSSSKLNVTVLSGSWRMTGTNKAYTGTTTISNGASLAVDCAISSPVSVQSGGTFSGSGSTSTNFSLTNGSVILRPLTNWVLPGSAFTAGRITGASGLTNWTIRLDASALNGFSETNKTIPVLSGPLTNIAANSVTLSVIGFAGSGTWSVGTNTNSLDLLYTPASLDAFAAWSNGIAWNGKPSGMRDDPDADGLANLAEYALGADPLAVSSGPASGVSGNRLSLTFTRTNDPALVYRVKASSSLAAWIENIWSSTGASNVNGPVTVVDTNTIGSLPARFLRLEISK